MRASPQLNMQVKLPVIRSGEPSNPCSFLSDTLGSTVCGDSFSVFFDMPAELQYRLHLPLACADLAGLEYHRPKYHSPKWGLACKGICQHKVSAATPRTCLARHAWLWVVALPAAREIHIPKP